MSKAKRACLSDGRKQIKIGVTNTIIGIVQFENEMNGVSWKEREDGGFQIEMIVRESTG